MTNAEKAHLSKVASLGCFLCRATGFGATPSQVHHLRIGQGMAQRNSHYLTVPLCDRHHSNASPDGIHGQRKAWKMASLDEIDALADTLELILGD